MQQFTVPQFIDVEDKVIGGLSVRQFIITLATFGVIAILYKIFDFSLFLFTAIIVLVTGGAFAFIRINGAPFHNFLLNILQTMMKPQLRTWAKSEREDRTKELLDDLAIFESEPESRRYTMSNLNRLSLIVDTRGYYSGEDDKHIDIRSLNNKQVLT